ncbi:MAG TPA: hypothetical protein VND93_31370, partial [Myxococcales bacterium]|nr:hypothetical protein [Myxococcales bacterium]
MSIPGSPDGAASPRTRSSDSIPATTANRAAEPRVSRDPPPANAHGAQSMARGVRYQKQGSDKSGTPAALSVSRLEDGRVEVTLERGGKKLTYVLDLSRADARGAYDDLMKFRTTRAELLAAKPARSGVEVQQAAAPAPAAATTPPAAPAAAKATAPAAAKPSVEVKGTVKPKLEKTTGPDGSVTKTKGGEVSGTLKAGSGQTKVDAAAKAKVELSTTTAKDGKVTNTKQVEVGGNATVKAPLGSGTVTAGAGAKVERNESTTTQGGKVVAKTQQQTVTLDQSVRVTAKDPRTNAGVTAKEIISSKVDTDAAGNKTTTRTSDVDVAADASVHAQVGKEENLDWNGSLDVRDFHTETETPDGKVARTDEETVKAQSSLKLADTTGPDQHSVKVSVSTNRDEKVQVGGDGKKTVTDTRALELGAGASASRTSGETTVSVTGNATRSDSSTTITGPDGKTQQTTQQKTAVDGSVTVADKTGPQQGSVTLKGSASRDTKTEVNGDGGVKRTDATDVKGTAAITTTIKDGDRTISTSTQVDAGATTNTVTNPDGTKSWTDATSIGVTNTDTISDKNASTTLKAQVKSTGSESGDEKGVKQQKGSLSSQVDLTTTFKGDRKVGFSGAGSKDYALSLPASSPTAPALPLDAASARALPPGASFTLTGKGKLGITGEAEGFKAGVSGERTLQIKVDRQAGNAVTATVDFGEKRTQNEGFDRKFGDPKKLNAQITAGNTGTDQRGRVDQFQLDLSNPAHQAAYDALLRGNLTPAQQLGVGKTLKATDATSNEQMAKVGISFSKLGASVELDRKDIDPSDDRIQGDPTRKAVTDAAQKDGREVRWIERGGAWELGGGYSYGASPGVAGFGFGFDGKKGMEWRSLGPRVDGEGGAPGVAMSADEAEKMPAGSEFSVRGTTSLSGRASVLGGWQAGGGGITVSAGVSFDASRSHSMDMNVRVKKLPDGRVEVRLDELKKDQASAQFAARLGATVNGAELAASGGSILGALAKRPDVAEKLAGLKKSLSV